MISELRSVLDEKFNSIETEIETIKKRQSKLLSLFSDMLADLEGKMDEHHEKFEEMYEEYTEMMTMQKDFANGGKLQELANNLFSGFGDITKNTQDENIEIIGE